MPKTFFKMFNFLGSALGVILVCSFMYDLGKEAGKQERDEQLKEEHDLNDILSKLSENDKKFFLKKIKV